MRFHATTTDRDGALQGTATNAKSDPARPFCNAYRSTALALLDPETLRLEPAIWAPPGIDRPHPKDALRFHFTSEEEPGVFEAVFGCLGHDPGEFDSIVLMHEDMLALPLDSASLLGTVIQDAASALTDESVDMSELLWARADLVRASIAAIITRAAERLLPGPKEVEAAYEEICACALAGMVDNAYAGGADGVARLVRENAGLIYALKRAVEVAREQPPLPLPVDAGKVLEVALRNLRGAAEANLRMAA